MNSITRHFTTPIEVHREVVNNLKKTYEKVDDATAHIQPIAETLSNGQIGRTQKEYKILTAYDIRIGDKIKLQTGAMYDVSAAAIYEWQGSSHYEGVMRGI